MCHLMSALVFLQTLWWCLLPYFSPSLLAERPFGLILSSGEQHNPLPANARDTDMYSHCKTSLLASATIRETWHTYLLGLGGHDEGVCKVMWSVDKCCVFEWMNSERLKHCWWALAVIDSEQHHKTMIQICSNTTCITHRRQESDCNS